MKSPQGNLGRDYEDHCHLKASSCLSQKPNFISDTERACLRYSCVGILQFAGDRSWMKSKTLLGPKAHDLREHHKYMKCPNGILQARILDCHPFLQGIFQTQGLNPSLLHCRQILYHLSYQGTKRVCTPIKIN